MEFKEFPKINRLNNIKMSITQKIHGSNAQVYIYENTRNLEIIQTGNDISKYQDKYPGLKLAIEPYDPSNSYLVEKFLDLKTGSRTRWIAPGNDNYGFAEFVYANKQEFIDKLGVGQHFGEWAGPGINSGEGLIQKTFILFNFWEFPAERPLPPQCAVVPVLYDGPFSLNKIEEISQDLKTNGSKLVPGFMRPEGVVINMLGTRVKVVFDAEETQWKRPDKIKAPKVKGPNVSYLLQPIRMQKILSKDSQYILNFPSSINAIKDAYIKDLIEEGHLKMGLFNAESVVGEMNQLHKEIYPFIKQMVFEQTNMEGY